MANVLCNIYLHILDGLKKQPRIISYSAGAGGRKQIFCPKKLFFYLLNVIFY